MFPIVVWNDEQIEFGPAEENKDALKTLLREGLIC